MFTNAGKGWAMSGSLNICIVASEFQPVPVATWGAIEAVVCEHARALAERGQQVHVLTVGAERRVLSETIDQVTYHRLGRAAVYGGGAAGTLTGSIRFGRAINERCRAIEPDIVHYHSRFPCYVSLKRARRERSACPMVYHAHNWKHAERMRYRRLSLRHAAVQLGRHVDKQIARRCDHVITTSRFMRDSIAATIGGGRDKISVLPNVVDTGLFKPGHATEPSDEVVFVGRVAEEKGLLTLIEAMPRVLREAPGLKLSVIGPEQGRTERGGYGRRCQQLVASLNLEAHVSFEGEVDNDRLPERITAAKAVVVPSVWGEPFGLVALEAIACGVPVVASRVGGLPEIIDQGETGMLVPPGDPEALAEALARVINDGALRRNVHQLGPRIVAERYTRDVIGDQLLAVYERLLG